VAERLEIEVTIAPDGQVRLVTRGLKGASCEAETEALEEALGRVVRRERTGEYYQESTSAKASVRRR
jgi:hypothetical protein